MAKTALVLSGGGGRGAYHIGVWQALREMDISPEIVTGTSVGAINGAMVAAGAFDAAHSVWCDIETGKILDLSLEDCVSPPQKIKVAFLAFFKDGMQERGFDTTPLQELLTRHIDEEKVRTSGVEFGIVTVGMHQKCPAERFLEDIPIGRLHDYVLASASLYPVMRPHKIDGAKYLDGAYYDNLPVQMALSKGAEKIIAVDLEAPGFTRGVPSGQAEKIIRIASGWPLGPVMLFEKERARRNIRLGYLDTLKAFRAYDGALYAFIRQGTNRAHKQKLQALLHLGNAARSAGQKAVHHILNARCSLRFHGRYRLEKDFLWICRELAGKIMGLCPLHIYSVSVFDARLREAAEKVAPFSFAGAEKGDWLKRAKDALLLMQKPARTLALVKLLAQFEDEPSKILPLVHILPEEYLAACYLHGIGYNIP